MLRKALRYAFSQSCSLLQYLLSAPESCCGKVHQTCSFLPLPKSEFSPATAIYHTHYELFIALQIFLATINAYLPSMANRAYLTREGVDTFICEQHTALKQAQIVERRLAEVTSSALLYAQ